MSQGGSTIEGVSELLARIKEKRLIDAPHHHLRWWFRGQGNAESALNPGVYRQGFAPDEDARLTIERHLAQDFHVESAGIRTGNESNEELYLLQQHYRLPTRLLDWTQNPLAGLFFAVRELHPSDGKLFMMDAYGLQSHIDESAPFYGIPTSRDGLFVTALHPILKRQQPDQFPKFIFGIRPDHFDRRISLQRSCFTFHVPSCPVLETQHNCTLEEFHIPQSAKLGILRELFVLGIDEASVFGDLEGLAQRLTTGYRLHDRSSSRYGR